MVSGPGLHNQILQNRAVCGRSKRALKVGRYVPMIATLMSTSEHIHTFVSVPVQVSVKEMKPLGSEEPYILVQKAQDPKLWRRGIC